MRRRLIPALALCLALPALAQDTSSGLVVQLRASSPMENLKDRVGSQVVPGASLGFSIPAEDGFGYRVLGGFDRFKEGDTAGQPGVRTAVDVSHLSIEGTYAFRGDNGPYIFCGLGGYAWSIKENDTVSAVSTTRRVTHMGLSLGAGYQVFSYLQVELRAAGGKAEAGLAAGYVGIAANLRF